MADNDISITNPHTFKELVGNSWYSIMKWIFFVLTLAAAIYGLTSWIIIKKFRHFRNYVLLSAITAKMISILFYHLTVLDSTESIQYPQVLVSGALTAELLLYFTVSFHCWLLVLCYIFYVDFVKVFSLDIRRRYLKSSLFAWGLPAISNLLLFVSSFFFYDYASRETTTSQVRIDIVIAMFLIPLAISFVIFLSVLYCLFRVSEAGGSISFNKWRRFYIATLIFVLSNVILLPVVHYIIFDGHILILAVIIELGDYLNTIALAVYLIILKSNRELWREFLDKRSKQKSLEIK